MSSRDTHHSIDFITIENGKILTRISHKHLKKNIYNDLISKINQNLPMGLKVRKVRELMTRKKTQKILGY